MALDVEGIVLKSFNYGEHHKIVKVLTEEKGVIGVFVQNANKVNTKKSALVQPLTCARFNLNYSHQANSDLYFAYSGDVIEYYLNLKLNYEHMAYFYCIISVPKKNILETLGLKNIFFLEASYLL